MGLLKNKAAIIGSGIYKFSKDSGLTELDMACRAIRSALDDANLTPDCIDGFVEYTEEDFDEILVARSMGIGNLVFHGDVRWDGAAAGSMIRRAAIAVASGAANYVVVVRSVNDSSLQRQKKAFGDRRTWESLEETFYSPYGLLSDAGRVGINVRRYMYENNLTNEAFGRITQVAREYGARNPNSLYFESPLGWEDYLASEVRIDPLREPDCSPPVDGAIAFIVAGSERAKQVCDNPVYITASAQCMVAGAQFKTDYYRPSITDQKAIESVGRQLFESAGLSHKDIDLLQIEDTYAPVVPMALEALGFCDRGMGVPFIGGGDRIRTDGELPVNTSGGSLGEGNLHGFNHIAEAVSQLRGNSNAQVKGTEHVMVVTGAFGPSSGLILGR
ncbi:MAG: hypothetical protein MI863_00880 [Desulfobacterales bacterium]|nr:hypothetical protein [Desulfobacterales bacterium]